MFSPRDFKPTVFPQSSATIIECTKLNKNSKSQTNILMTTPLNISSPKYLVLPQD